MSRRRRRRRRSRRRHRRALRDPNFLPDGAAVVDAAFPDSMPGGPREALKKALADLGSPRAVAEDLLYEEMPKAGLEVADGVTVSDVEDAVEAKMRELSVDRAARHLCAECRREKEAGLPGETVHNLEMKLKNALKIARKLHGRGEITDSQWGAVQDAALEFDVY